MIYDMPDFNIPAVKIWVIFETRILAVGSGTNLTVIQFRSSFLAFSGSCSNKYYICSRNRGTSQFGRPDSSSSFVFEDWILAQAQGANPSCIDGVTPLLELSKELSHGIVL